MATLHGLEDPEVQQKMMKLNAGTWDPRVDRNMLREPDRMIHIFSVSPRQFIVDRAPLWVKLHLRACPKGERYIPVAHIPDPLMQMVHNTENGRRRGEAHDGLRAAIDLLNPNNPTNDPDWNPSPEMAALFGSSKGCDLFAQGLFVSLNEIPGEGEIAKAEERRDARRRMLIAHADSLEQTNRKELEEFLKGEDGLDLRLALDFFGEERQYHKPMIATRPCPNCGTSIKSGIAFHLLPNNAFCINNWPAAVEAGVKTKSDVPPGLRWWIADEEEDEPEPPIDGTAPAAKPAAASRSRSQARQRSSK
jgi:hypothetical protein